ncbi:hypothetical protein NBE98_03260 [Clostridium swellfunianum]|uniref:hypothetical protein n=1 Tax=Clostridium swellfunianum TaxID=1367462 RepID=UPI00202EE087|nr:hypothetical protein [Clostridium swellfunianum]MCM0647394.1 hypothetical protein [Clostridium swellfunianum]
MGFTLITLTLWALYTFLMKRNLGNEFMFSKSLIPLILICLISTMCLGINYVASAVPSLNDGIGIHNFWAGLIIGEDSWSVQLFKTYFNLSVYASLFLTFIYSISALLKK